MLRKKIEYREVGINRQLRRDYIEMKRAQLDRACEALRDSLSDSFKVNYYEAKRAYVNNNIRLEM